MPLGRLAMVNWATVEIFVNRRKSLSLERRLSQRWAESRSSCDAAACSAFLRGRIGRTTAINQDEICQIDDVPPL